jgi:hypothetical protein
MTRLETDPRTEGVVVRAKLVRRHRAHGRVEFSTQSESPASPRTPVRRPARIAQMLALAHQLERSIDAGVYADRADAARSLGLTRARITQLCDLLGLAPDLQEALLRLESVDGVEPTTEHAIRPVLRMLVWSAQRAWWRQHDPVRSL